MTVQAVAAASCAADSLSAVMRSGHSCSSSGAVSLSAVMICVKSATFAAYGPILCIPQAGSTA